MRLNPSKLPRVRPAALEQLPPHSAKNAQSHAIAAAPKTSTHSENSRVGDSGKNTPSEMISSASLSYRQNHKKPRAARILARTRHSNICSWENWLFSQSGVVQTPVNTGNLLGNFLCFGLENRHIEKDVYYFKSFIQFLEHP